MTVPFLLGTFSVAGCPPFAGVVIEDCVIAVTALQPFCQDLGRQLNGPETVFGLVQDWERNFPVLRASLVELLNRGLQSVASIKLDQMTIHAPVLYPRQVICADFTTRQVNIILPSTIIGPYDPILVPGPGPQASWEMELAIIIGKPGRHILRSQALAHVAGYMIANDITSSSEGESEPGLANGVTWLLKQGKPGILAMGPYLVPAAFVPDLELLHTSIKHNNQVLQNADSLNLEFGVPQLVEEIFANISLWPGDVICAGPLKTQGTNLRRRLQPGDQLELAIDGLGTQRNQCIAEKAAEI